MAGGGKPIPLTIDEKEKLLTMSHSRKFEKWYVKQAEIILLSGQDMALDEIVDHAGPSRPVANN